MIAKKLPKKIQVRERKLGREKADGLAWDGKKPLVEIDPRQGEKGRLDTLLHEATHILFPKLNEMQVRGISKRLTTILWKDGWRRVRGLSKP
jgi:hypothetical protein